MERRMMTLVVRGGAAGIPGRAAREDLCRASGEWLERAELRKPERVRVIAGRGDSSAAEEKIFAWLKKCGTPVTACVAADDAAAARALADDGLNVDVTEVGGSGDAAGGIVSKVRAGGAPGRLEIAFAVCGSNLGAVEGLIRECAASAESDRGARGLLLMGNGAATAGMIEGIRSRAAGWRADAAAGRTELRFEGVPLCAVPGELLPYTFAACADGGGPGDASKLLAECAGCLLRGICDYPEEDPGAGVGRVLVSVKSVNDLPWHVRRGVAERVRAEAEDGLFRLQVFGGCNNRCEDCPDKVYAKPGTSTRNALKLITKAWASGAVTVAFTDGEPSLRKDLPTLLKIVSWYGMSARLHTNARLLSVDGFVRGLLQYGNLTVAARLAGYDAATHDGVTNAESFAQSVAGVRNAVAKGLRTEVQFRLRPEIAGHVDRLLSLGAELGAPVVIDVPSHWSYFPDVCTYNELMKVIEAALDGYFASGEGRPPVSIQGMPVCLLGRYQGLNRGERGPEFAKPPVCEDCSASGFCCGLPERYTLEFGSSELRPEIANADSSLRFARAREMTGFDIAACPIKAGSEESPEAGAHLILREDGGYALYAGEDTGMEGQAAVAVKNAGRGGAAVVEGGVERGARLCGVCAGCGKLHECAGCFEAVDKAQPELEIRCEPRTLLVRRDDSSPAPAGVEADETITFRNFWTRMSRGGAGMPLYRTIVIHDSADFFPSAERAMWHIARLAPRGCRVIVTGRNARVEAGGARGRDSVPAMHPWSIRTEGTALRLVDGSVSGRFWMLDFVKEDEPHAGPLREKLASLFVIRACVARCMMCNVQNFFESARTPLERVLRGLDELRLNGFEFVDIFGGEVTLRDDLAFIVRYASGIGLKPMIITTGHSLDDAAVARLRDAGAVKISVSLDGDEAPLHDMIKGADGMFERALGAIGAAARVPGVEVNVNTVVLPENFGRLARITALAGSRGADVARFFLCVSSPAASPVRRVLDKTQLGRLVDEYLPEAREVAARMGMEVDFRPEPPDARTRDEWIGRVASGHYNPLTPDVAGTCAAPDVRTLVDVDGAVYPCEAPLLFASEHVLGNISEEPLVRILGSEKMKGFRERAGRFAECEMCFGAMPVCGWEAE